MLAYASPWIETIVDKGAPKRRRTPGLAVIGVLFCSDWLAQRTQRE
jgi:hypothetical protein